MDILRFVAPVLISIGLLIACVGMALILVVDREHTLAAIVDCCTWYFLGAAVFTWSGWILWVMTKPLPEDFGGFD